MGIDATGADTRERGASVINVTAAHEFARAAAPLLVPLFAISLDAIGIPSKRSAASRRHSPINSAFCNRDSPIDAAIRADDEGRAS